jgi:23S rRNA pseudouridine1911/1915/1917 synthase
MPEREQPFAVTEAYRGMRLDRFLQAMLPRMSRAAIQDAIDNRVRLGSGRAAKASLRPAIGDTVFFGQRVQTEVPDLEIPVLAEGQGWSVINKPAGVASTPSARRPGADIATMLGKAPAHRLDYGTSGCLLLVHEKAAAQHFELAFRERRIAKQYLAVVKGAIDRDSFKIDAAIGRDEGSRLPHKVMVTDQGSKAITRIEVVERRGDRTVVRARPETGRRHQIRVHLAHIGHPLVGDLLYGGDERKFIRWQLDQPVELDDGVVAGRHLLHAESITLPLPGDERERLVEAPRPPDFDADHEAR